MAEKQTKYIFVTGGVVSGLGKGITAASLGRLLKCRGLKVASGGAVLPGHPPDFQVSVVAAEILQAHGGQKLRPRQTG